MYKNWKILKSELNQKQEEYSKVAQWCNETQEYTIEDDGECYKVVKIPEPTEEEIKENVRTICSQYINNISWRVERYNTQKELGIETSDITETYLKILEYMQYLRNFDKQEGKWWMSNPLIFEEWQKLMN